MKKNVFIGLHFYASQWVCLSLHEKKMEIEKGENPWNKIKKSAICLGEILHSSKTRWTKRNSMAGLIRHSTSSRGKPVVIDKYHDRYTLNNFSTTQNYWRCAIRSCSARLTTRISRKDLCSSDLPEHSHGNQILKKIAKKHEQENIKEMSKPSSSTTTKAVLQEIS